MKKYILSVLTVIISISVFLSSILIPVSLIASAEDTSVDYSLYTGRQTWKFDTAPENENFQINMLNAGVDTTNGYFYAPTNWSQKQPVNYEFNVGKTYIVNIKWKVSAKPTDGFQFQLRVGDTAFKDYGWMKTVPTEWQTDRIQFTATNKGLLYIFMNAGIGQTLYIDTISVYEVGSSVRFDFSDDTQIKALYNDKVAEQAQLTENGTFSTKVNGQWTTNNQFVLDYVIENGKKYNVKFRYKANAVTSGNSFRVNYNKGNGKWDDYKPGAADGFASPTINTPVANTWYDGEFTFVAENDSTNPYIGFMMRATKVATYEFDDVAISEVKQPNVGTIVLDTGDGKTENADLGELVGGDIYVLPTLSRTGYQFVAWHTNSELTNPVETVTVPNKGESITLYAEWNIQSYYKLDFSNSTDLEVGASWFGGSGCNPEIKELDGEIVLSVRGSKNLSASTARLPIALKPGTYRYSFKYRANPAENGDKYSLSFLVSNNEATDNTTLAAGKTISSVFAWEELSTENEFYVKSGNVTITDEMISNTANKLTLLFKTSKEADMLYIDDFEFALSTPVTVSFEVDGGDEIENLLTTSGSTIKLPKTLKGGKTLEGWYDDPTFSNKIGNVGDEYIIPNGSETLKLYVKWVDESEWSFTFEDKDDLDVGTSWFADYAPSIADDNGNGALLIKGNKDMSNCVARLPLALSANATYTYSFDYKTIPVENGDSYTVSLAIVDNKATDNTTLNNGIRVSTALSFVRVSTGDSYKNVFGTFTVTEDIITSNANRLAIYVKTSKQDDIIWIDNFNIKKVTNPTYTTSKTYDFNDATGILSPAAGSAISNGALVIDSGWGKYMSLDYILKDNKAYNITMYYKVALKEGQDYQSFKLLYDYGTASSHDYKTQNVGTSGWIAGKSKEYTGLVSSFTMSTTGIEDGKCFFWLGFDMDPGTDEDAAVKGGGKIYIDKIVISEKKKVEYSAQKEFKFDDMSELLSLPSGSNVKDGNLIHNCDYGKWLGLEYVFNNNQQYEITIKYKVKLAKGQEYQAMNFAVGYGSDVKSEKTISNFGWHQLSNKEYDTFVSRFTITPNMVSNGSNYLWLYLNGYPGTEKGTEKKGGGTLYIDSIVVKEKAKTTYSADKEFKFDDKSEILALPSGSTVQDGNIVFNCDWNKWLGLEYMLENNQQYEITIKYKVKLAKGQEYQSMNLAVGYGNGSKSEKTITNFGWYKFTNQEYDTFVSRFTVEANTVSNDSNYLWLFLNGDPGTDKNAAVKGGGTLYIDSIFVKEKAKTTYSADKEFKFDDKSEILALPSGSTVQDGNIVFNCDWNKWLGLEYMLKNNQQYEITIKYKVKLAKGQEYQSMNLAVGYGNGSKSEKTITNFGWYKFTNQEYDTFVSRYTVEANAVSNDSNYLWLFLNGDPGTDKDAAVKGGGTLYIDSIIIKEKEPLTAVKKKTWTFDDKSELLSLPSLATVKDGALVDKCGWGQNLGLAYIFEPNRTYQITIKYKVDKPNQSLHLVLYSGSMTAKKNIMGTIINWKRVSDLSYTTLTYEIDTNAEMFKDGNNLMWIYLNNNPEYGATLYIDEITVENMGPLDYRLYGNAIESYEWKAYEEDTEYSDWKQWELKAASSNNSDSVDIEASSKNIWIYIIIGFSVILLAGVATIVVIIRKKKLK